MALVLTITDGTTTIDFATSGTGYKILRDSWAPAVASRRQSQLGGQSVYNDVTETMIIDVSGTTTAQALSRLKDITDLVDQAFRWSEGHDVDPVYIRYLPDGSTAVTPYYECLILGAPTGEQPIDAPNDFERAANVKHITPITLRFSRRGLWLSPEDTPVGLSPVVKNPNPAVLTFTSEALLPSPVDIALVGMDYTASFSVARIPEGLIMIADKDDGAITVEAESMSAAGAPVVTVDATASGGFYVAMTDADQLGFSWVSATFPSKRFVVYGAFRAGVSADEWQITSNYSTGAGDLSSRVFFEDTYITGSTDKQPIFLGVFDTEDPQSHSFTFLVTDVSAGSTNSGSLDCDYVCFCSLDGGGRVIEVDASILAGSFLGSETVGRKIITGEYDERQPALWTTASTTGLLAKSFYHGNSWAGLTGDTVSLIWMCPQGADWIHTDDSGDGIYDMQISLARRKACLIPE